MKRFKQIMFFVIVIFAFAIFSDFMMKVGIRNTYKTIQGEIKTYSPQITVSEAKTTDVNGYAKGTIKNNSDEDIDIVYIKIDLFSKRNVNLGTEYLEIRDLKNGDTREFEIKYRFSNVDHYELTCVSEI